MMAEEVPRLAHVIDQPTVHNLRNNLYNTQQMTEELKEQHPKRPAP